MSQLGSIRIGPAPSARRQWSIRAKIVALLLAPLIPLLVMTVFTVAVTLGPATNLRNARTSVDGAGFPAAILATQLQQERALSVVYTSTPTRRPETAALLSTARAATDTAIANLTTSTTTPKFLDAESTLTRSSLAKLRTALDDLTTDRRAVDTTATRVQVMTYYNDTIDNTLNLYGSIAALDDHVLARQANAMVGLAESNEMLAREDSLVSGVFAAGQMTSHDYTALVGTIATQRRMFADSARYLPATDRAAYQTIQDSPEYKRLRAMENTIVANPALGSLPRIDLTSWQDSYGRVVISLGLFERAQATRTINATGAAATSRTVRLVVATIICLVMLLILILISIRIARTLIRRVAKLRMEAISLALDRLPSVVDRLRRGERVDVEAEAPPLEAGQDELGQLSEAFTRVQHTAVASAVHEATLRQGFNQVFLNIARRNQTLLHRQLALLDGMERRATDPDDLEELFRIDHLATRMRRHAEDLVILAGSTPGRGWRVPVPIADVLRASASEVEEYARINVASLPNLALVGRAVSDVVHLLAELLENATLFSPPDTQVTLAGQAVPNGFAVEIEDRGLGMTAEAIDEANGRLANPPDFDPAHSARLGLFVVARLAARQGISVVLRRSPYGGVTAVTLIPMELVVAADRVDVVPDTSTVELVGPRESGRALALVAAMPASAPPAPAAVGRAPKASIGPGTGSVPPPGTRRVEVATANTVPMTSDGLPQRVRQVNLARTPPESSVEPESAPLDTPVMSRTPERMRTMLASFQDGTVLGRRNAATQSESGNLPGPAGNGSDGGGNGGGGGTTGHNGTTGRQADLSGTRGGESVDLFGNGIGSTGVGPSVNRALEPNGGTDHDTVHEGVVHGTIVDARRVGIGRDHGAGRNSDIRRDSGTGRDGGNARDNDTARDGIGETKRGTGDDE